MEIKMQRTRPEAYVPTRREMDGGFDVRLPFSHIVPANTSMRMPTGLAFEMPEGWHLMALQKSRHYGKILVEAPLVDNGYRGEVHAVVHNLTELDIRFAQGDAVMQLMPVFSPHMAITEVVDISETARGDGAFGSTG